VSNTRRRAAAAGIGAVVLTVGVLAVGGYAAGWAWTGLSSRVKLWDWLEALALPLAVGLVPVVLTHRHRLHRRHKRAGAGVLVVFVALVIAGYLVPLRWTGFTGNTLWDWLSLALLPVVIATSTLWETPGDGLARHRLAVTAAAAVAVAVVLAGYLVPWAWTGFVGNTAWDWVKLLLLPVIVPTLLLPRLVTMAGEWMERREPEE
jgi:hypothetical protein